MLPRAAHALLSFASKVGEARATTSFDPAKPMLIVVWARGIVSRVSSRERLLVDCPSRERPLVDCPPCEGPVGRLYFL